MQVFVDFDGTIAVNDVGDLLFDTFGRPDWREMNAAWERGEVTTRQCLAHEARFLQTDPARLACESPSVVERNTKGLAEVGHKMRRLISVKVAKVEGSLDTVLVAITTPAALVSTNRLLSSPHLVDLTWTWNTPGERSKA